MKNNGWSAEFQQDGLASSLPCSCSSKLRLTAGPKDDSNILGAGCKQPGTQHRPQSSKLWQCAPVSESDPSMACPCWACLEASLGLRQQLGSICPEHFQCWTGAALCMPGRCFPTDPQPSLLLLSWSLILR